MNEKNVEISDSLEDLLGIEKSDKPAKSVENKEDNSQKSSNNSESSKSPQSEGVKLIDMEELENASRSSIGEKSHNSNLHLSTNMVDETGFIQCPPNLDTIYITRKAFEDLILVAKAINEISVERWGRDSEKLEVYMYVFAEPDEIESTKPSRVSSIYIPYHTATETSVNVDQEGILEVTNYIKSTNKVLLGWAHSHGHFEVYSSKTDEINHQLILSETSNYIQIKNFQLKYVYSITVVESGERYGVVLTQYPCSHIQNKSDSKFDIEGDPYSPTEKEARYLELKEILEERATVVKPKDGKSNEDIIKELTEELLSEFIRKLRKIKNLLFNEMPENVEEQFELIQNLLQNYDNLLLDGVEESFTVTAEKLVKMLKKYTDSH
jgi:hypothetical protein